MGFEWRLVVDTWTDEFFSPFFSTLRVVCWDMARKLQVNDFDICSGHIWLGLPLSIRPRRPHKVKVNEPKRRGRVCPPIPTTHHYALDEGWMKVVAVSHSVDMLADPIAQNNARQFPFLPIKGSQTCFLLWSNLFSSVALSLATNKPIFYCHKDGSRVLQ